MIFNGDFEMNVFNLNQFPVCRLFSQEGEAGEKGEEGEETEGERREGKGERKREGKGKREEGQRGGVGLIYWDPLTQMLE